MSRKNENEDGDWVGSGRWKNALMGLGLVMCRSFVSEKEEEECYDGCNGRFVEGDYGCLRWLKSGRRWMGL